MILIESSFLYGATKNRVVIRKVCVQFYPNRNWILVGSKSPVMAQPPNFHLAIYRLVKGLVLRFCVFGAMQKLKIVPAAFQPITGLLRTTAYLTKPKLPYLRNLLNKNLCTTTTITNKITPIKTSLNKKCHPNAKKIFKSGLFKIETNNKNKIMSAV